MTTYRKISDRLGNEYLLRVQDGRVTFLNKRGFSYSLSAITDHCAELEYSLEDTMNSEEIDAALSRYIYPQMTFVYWSPVRDYTSR